MTSANMVDSDQEAMGERETRYEIVSNGVYLLPAVQWM